MTKIRSFLAVLNKIHTRPRLHNSNLFKRTGCSLWHAPTSSGDWRTTGDVWFAIIETVFTMLFVIPIQVVCIIPSFNFAQLFVRAQKQISTISFLDCRGQRFSFTTESKAIMSSIVSVVSNETNLRLSRITKTSCGN